MSLASLANSQASRRVRITVPNYLSKNVKTNKERHPVSFSDLCKHVHGHVYLQACSCACVIHIQTVLLIYTQERKRDRDRQRDAQRELKSHCMCAPGHALPSISVEQIGGQQTTALSQIWLAAWLRVAYKLKMMAVTFTFLKRYGFLENNVSLAIWDSQLEEGQSNLKPRAIHPQICASFLLN